MQLNPYLSFNGNCEEAFKFYERCLGGKIVAMITHAEAPMADKFPAEWQKKIMHARLVIGDQVLMGSDTPSEQYQVPQGFSVTVGPSTAEEAERIFHGLAEGGNVRMPIEKTFWAVRFGVLVDRFGIPWMVNCEQAAERSGG